MSKKNSIKITNRKEEQMRRFYCVFRIVFTTIGIIAVLKIFPLDVKAKHKEKLIELKSVPKRIAIIGGTIIDGTGRDPIKDGVILIQDSIISAVGQRKRITLPKDCLSLLSYK